MNQLRPKTRPHRFALILLAIFVAGPAAVSEGAPITATFSGVWSSGFGVPGVGAGDSFSGTFAYDSSTPDSDVSPAAGAYAATLEMTISSGPFGFSSTIFRDVAVDNAATDSFATPFHPRDTNMAPLVGAPAVFSVVMQLVLADSSATAFGSDALPLTLATGQFDTRTFQVIGFDSVTGGSPVWQLAGTLTSLNAQPVPEPGTLLLAALGGAGLSVGVWRRRRAAIG